MKRQTSTRRMMRHRDAKAASVITAHAIRVSNGEDVEMFSTHPHWRMRVVGSVLESAIDADQLSIVMACRRLIDAHHKGWNRHARARDWNDALDVYDNIVMAES